MLQRFGNPLPLNTSFDGVFDATQYGNVCPGMFADRLSVIFPCLLQTLSLHSGYGVSSTPNATAGQNYVIDEDCLNINVIRPSGTSENDKLPVLFWIYGGKSTLALLNSDGLADSMDAIGGFVQGTANDPRYNGTYIVQRSVEIGKPIIFASIKSVFLVLCQ